ncbi:MAG: MFS transporter [Candidatus Diapherotrites archaeon]
MKNDLMLFLLVFLFFFASRVSFFFIPIYLAELNFTGFEIGLLVGLSSVAAFIAFFPSGFVNDKKSVKKPLLLSFILLSAFYSGITFFSGFIAFFALFLFGGIGLKVGTNSLRNYFLKSSPQGKEGNTMGLYKLVVMLGVFCGVLVVSVLVPVFEFNLVLQGVSFLFILLIFFLFFFKDIKSSDVKVFQYKDDFLKKNILFFSLILFLFTLHWGAESTSYGLFLQEFFNLDFFQMGLYMALPLPFLGFSAYYFGKKVDAKKIDFLSLFAVGVLLSGLTHILMTFNPIEFSFLMRVIHEFADGMVEIGLIFWIFRSFDFKRLAGNASLIMTVTVLGELIGAVVFSTIGGIYGYNWPFILTGITSIMAAGLFLIYKKKYAERGN